MDPSPFNELLIVHASQFLTLAGAGRPRVGVEMRDLGIVEDGAVLIRDGRITAAGPTTDVERLAGPNVGRVDASGSVVMPGFVDAHTHPVFAGTREEENPRRK
jgi:imidazolonepropionase